ncbi:hypothetical protein KAR91_16470 [Candidatus Pacearchaeota archaeon]|nr:hypothetical protein [Candidatus Pacearchaeota archaeon]
MPVDIIKENQITVTRQNAGSFVSGTWVQGVSLGAFEMTCSIQPLSGKDLMNLPEAQRTKRTKKVFSECELKTADLATQKPADRFTFGGITYEVHNVLDYTDNNITHYEVIGVEIDAGEATRK